jgi:putative PIN family toxin of toxin-antitoxin system
MTTLTIRLPDPLKAELDVISLEDKLRHKLRIPRAIIAEYTKILESNAQILTPEVIDSTACRDPDDLMVLGVALGGRADVIITGDKDLLTLKSFNGIQIVTPRMFWETNQKQE